MLLRSAPRGLHLLRPQHLRLLSAAASASAAPAPPQLPTEWAEAPLACVRPATADASLFHVSLDLSAHGELLASHAAAGQFLPFRLPAAPYPIFLAIASPPPPPLTPEAGLAGSGSPSCFDFLVKRLPGTPSARLCDLRPGDLVHVGASVVGRGFDVARIADARDVLVFATGSGIRCLSILADLPFPTDYPSSSSLAKPASIALHRAQLLHFTQIILSLMQFRVVARKRNNY
jgi:hypothetical protein